MYKIRMYKKAEKVPENRHKRQLYLSVCWQWFMLCNKVGSESKISTHTFP